MTVDARIALGVRQPDIVGQMGRAAQAAGVQNQVVRQNRLMDLFQQQGPGIIAGEQGALNALSQQNPEMALGVQQTQLGMNATRQNMAQSAEMHKAKLQQIRQSAARAAAEAAREQDARILAQETAEAKQLVSQALMDPANADKYLAQSEHTRDFVGQDLESVAVAIMGAEDGLKYALEQRQGPEPLSPEGKRAADVRAGILPDTPPGPDPSEVDKFRKEFSGNAQVKAFSEQAQAYGRVLASAQTPSPAGDLALIFNYMKILDPGSVVRESEFATAAQSGAYGERIRAQVNRVVNGQRLSDEMRNDFVSRSEALYRQAEMQYRAVEQQYRDIAEDRAFGSAAMIDYAFPEGGSNSPQGTQEIPQPTQPQAPGGGTSRALDQVESDLRAKYPDLFEN